jgi:hypothetical protein
MIRIHSNPDQDPLAIAGAIEHLGTGEKLTFAGGEELLRLLGSRPDRAAKVPPGSGGSNRSTRIPRGVARQLYAPVAPHHIHPRGEGRPMSAHSSLTAAAVFLGTLFVVACSETTSPTPPTASFQLGNSDAAHACQQGGYQDLFRTDGSGFKNAGDCVSYAAQGGVLATRQTATFTNVLFAACNQLTWGYELDGVGHDFETFEGGCPDAAVPGSDQTVSFLSTQTLRVFLHDDSCGDTYFEGGNHSLVTGTNPSLIQITDSGGFCESDPDNARPPVGGGNLNVTKTIS